MVFHNKWKYEVIFDQEKKSVDVFFTNKFRYELKKIKRNCRLYELYRWRTFRQQGDLTILISFLSEIYRNLNTSICFLR